MRPDDHRLRVIVLTGGPLRAVDRVLVERLAGDARLDVCAVLVDGRGRRRLAERVRHGLRAEGWRWVVFALTAGLSAVMRKAALAVFELTHPGTGPDESDEALQRAIGAPVYRVADIQGEPALEYVRSLRPQLGVLLGLHAFRGPLTSAPEYGTIAIVRRKVSEHRGEAPVGYWELVTGARSVGVAIVYLAPEGDTGPVLAEATIPIEACDTLESLRIKADILGARLCHDTVREIAAGRREGVPLDTSQAVSYGAPGDWSVWGLERRLKRRAAALMPALRERPSGAVWVRLLVQYAILFPFLAARRRRLVARGQAPICTLFYHVVGNSPVNHMCLPLEDFVRQVDFLRRHYPVLPLDDAAARLGSGTNTDLAASITFDDGYRDNAWAVEYLQYFGVPAAFFVSIGHVLDGTPFEHDRRHGFDGAAPMSDAEVQRLADEGFLVGSHGVYHEDFGTLDAETADRVLGRSRDLIEKVTGRAPDHFAFPKGQRGRNITRETFELATRHYRFVYSAYGGYSFPDPARRHFLRVGHPTVLLELAMIMDGYVGFRRCLAGDAWGLETDRLLPY